MTGVDWCADHIFAQLWARDALSDFTNVLESGLVAVVAGRAVRFGLRDTLARGWLALR